MENKNQLSIKSIVAIGIGAALFFVLGRFVAIPSPVPNTTINIQYGILGVFCVIYGPVVGVLSGFIGHTLIDLSWGSPWYICSMKRLYALLKVGLQRLRKYISPVFLALLAVSFTLWYISKLNYTYTTDFNIKVKVEGERINVPCVVEGKGTNLFGYGFYQSRRANIPLSELQHEVIEVPVFTAEGVVDTLTKAYKVRISPVSMQDALSVRFSDLKIVSVGNFDDIPLQQR